MARLFKRLLLAALLAASLISYGGEWVSDDAGVSFQLPTGPEWAQIKGPRAEAKFVLQRTDKTAAVVFIAFEKKPGPRIMNEDFVKGWEKGYYRKGGAEKISGEFFSFKGKRVQGGRPCQQRWSQDHGSSHPMAGK